MKKVVIFCAGGYGMKVFYSLDPLKYEVLAFIDNCEEIWGKYNEHELGKIIIDSPMNVSNYDFDFVILPIAEYSTPMRDQLLSLGVDEKKIVDFMAWNENLAFDEERLAVMRKCVGKLIKEQVPGNLAELGVYKGEFAKHLNYYMPDKKLYLFDTFEGFSNQDNHQKDDVFIWQGHFRDSSAEEVLQKMTNRENGIVKKGYFPDTAEGVGDEFCFVSLDADLYLPILNGLEFFYPRLVHGGYIFVHDVYSYNWTGCKKAVDEYCKQHKLNYVPVLDRCGTVILTK